MAIIYTAAAVFASSPANEQGAEVEGCALLYYAFGYNIQYSNLYNANFL
jgi:hypothetical protein